MKPYIKQREFSLRSSDRNKRPDSFVSAELPIAYLDTLSCFETMRAYRGRIFRLKQHLERLCASAAGLGRRFSIRETAADEWVLGSLKESGFREAVLRFSIHESKSGDLRWVIIVREFKGHEKALYQEGITLNTPSYRRDLPKAGNSQIKCSQYVSGVLASIDLSGLDPREILFLDQNQMVSEGSVSNIFIVKQKTVLTAGVASGILMGVTRSAVFEAAKNISFLVKETFLTRHELYTADECFMTNTSSQILPVVRVDGRPIGSGKPGPVTRRLIKSFEALVKKELEFKK